MRVGVSIGTLVLAAAGSLAAQQPAPPPLGPPPLAVGVEAPDFTLPASTMAGLSAKPVHLKDLRGKTVVLAFFYRARTKG
jgi:cytochrome oxidase Cu insertion factor (SCO1/SenC/PrrC family)